MTWSHQCRSEKEIERRDYHSCNVRDITGQKCNWCFHEYSELELNLIRSEWPQYSHKYAINCMECDEWSYLKEGRCHRIHNCPIGTHEDWQTCTPYHCEW